MTTASFDHTHARERSQIANASVPTPLPPGKRSGTDRLAVPAADHVDALALGEAVAPALTGTAFLDGVLGFGESSNDAEVAEGRTDVPVGTGSSHRKQRPIQVKTTTLLRAPNGAPDSRRTIGVGETVRLESTAAGSWSAIDGTKHGATSRQFLWTAPEHGGSMTVTFHHANKTIDTKLLVVSPNTLAMKVATLDSIPKGTMGAGMITNVTIGPASVSFGNVEWLEVPGGPTGVYGYFKDHGAPNHHPNPSWLPWNSQNTGLQDHASIAGYSKPWYPGGFTWYIPNKYRVTTVGGSGHVFIHTHQVFKITDKKGTTTVTKGGAGVTRSP